MVDLTKDSLSNIHKGIVVENPIVQIMDASTVIVSDGRNRIKVFLSDGENSILGYFLGPGIKEKFKNIDELFYTVLKLTEYVLQHTDNIFFVVIFSFEVIERREGVIGNPGILNNTMAKEKTFEKKEPNWIDTLKVQEISTLNPYQKNTIFKGTVNFISDITEWTQGTRTGTVAYCDIFDSSLIIRCLMFNDYCKKFHHLFEKGKDFIITNGQVKPSNRKFSTLTNDYEIVLNENSTVHQLKSNEDDGFLEGKSLDISLFPSLEFSFDVLVLVKNIRQKRKDNLEVLYLLIEDEWKNESILILSKEHAKYSKIVPGDVLFVKNVQKSSEGGNMIETGSMTSIMINLPTNQVKTLSAKFESSM
eukprot:gene246-4492_t